MSLTRALLTFGVALLACSGCVTSMAGARSQFAQDETCPDDRVSVAAEARLPTVASPPPDVASDPQRLAMWQRADEQRERSESREKYYVAKGCGQTQVYHCYHCVDMPDKTVCGTVPNCEVASQCHESQPGYVTCDG